MKIILCGGGTSGHIYPALAIADAIKEKLPDTELLFIGREGGFENRAVKKSNIKLTTLKIEGISRNLSLKNIKRLKLAADAKKKAVEIVKDFEPDVVVGTGGYVCWPVITAAQKLGIPTLIHESNVYPGLVTKLLAPKTNCVLLNYPDTKKYLPKKSNTEIIGNPLRSDFSKISKKSAKKELKIGENDIFIVSFGGSGGAKELNEILTSLMKKSFVSTPNIFHLHATGNKYFDEYKNLDLSKAKGRCKIVPFIEDMPKKLAAADIVISRAGAMTLSEISLLGAASILIPSPNVTNNHQLKNAKLLSDAKACILIEEKDLSEELLRSKIERLIKDTEGRVQMGKRAEKFAKKDAAKTAASKIIAFYRK